MMSVPARALLVVAMAVVLAPAVALILLPRHLPLGSPNGIVWRDSPAQSKIVQSYGKLPLSFEANQGQTDPHVKFLSHGADYSLFLTGDEAVFSLRERGTSVNLPRFRQALQARPEQPVSDAVLRMRLHNANPAAKMVGVEELKSKSNYFIGNDPKSWRRNVPTYNKVEYEAIYRGINLVYYGNQGQLEYDFVVTPGADPGQIQLDFLGNDESIKQDEKGDLLLRVGKREFYWRKPLVYQKKDGTRQEVAAHYIIKDKNRVEFAVANHDSGRTLFIDPLVYSTYLGGTIFDEGLGIAVDGSGDAYVAGATSSNDFPTMNPLQSTYHGGGDVFVAKINPAGSLIYSTYLGGSQFDQGYGIAVDRLGNTYVTGITESTDFPTTNALQPSFGGGLIDAFVAKINPAGSALVYSTYLGGSGQDNATGIAVDNAGSAYIIGNTTSNDFPTKKPLQATNSGDGDVFLAKINPTGSALVYSTYLGGSGNDVGTAIAQLYGAVYVAGYTNSTNFPTANPLQPNYGGGFEDAFVAKINSSGSALVYSTYLGGSKNDSGFGIAVDITGNAYVTGATTSTNFPTVSPFQRTLRGGNDVFVSKINPSGSALVYSSYLGGSADDYGYSIAVDLGGNAYVTGLTLSTNFRTVKPLQAASGGNGDAFAAKINSAGSALAYSTYLGGSGVDQGNSITQHAGNAYITGYTESTDFPTMNPLQSANGGNADAFITVISKPSP
jgi:hypothetical protein